MAVRRGGLYVARLAPSPRHRHGLLAHCAQTCGASLLHPHRQLKPVANVSYPLLGSVGIGYSTHPRALQRTLIPSRRHVVDSAANDVYLARYMLLLQNSQALRLWMEAVANQRCCIVKDVGPAEERATRSRSVM
jgi:hypothetical protein